jgi:hypothetical protein
MSEAKLLTADELRKMTLLVDDGEALARAVMRRRHLLDVGIVAQATSIIDRTGPQPTGTIAERLEAAKKRVTAACDDLRALLAEIGG